MSRRCWWWRGGFALFTVVAVVAALLFTTRPSSPARPAAVPSGSAPQARNVALALAVLERAKAAIESGAATAGPDPTPTCKPPSLPQPTFPNDPANPGQGYGVPFLAEITGSPLTGPLGTYPATGAKLLGGYDVQWANGQAAGHYTQVWKTVAWNITGWTSGLLEVPSLQSVVSPKDIVFCTSTSKPPTTIYDALPNGITTPNNTYITNDQNLINAEGGLLLPLGVTVKAFGAKLGVTGVEKSGALDLGGSTTASVTITDNSGTTQTCRQASPTTINISTKATPEPAGGPPGAIYPMVPQPLTGAVRQSGASLTSNAISIPRFEVGSTCALGALFNVALAGFNASGVSNWPCTVNPNCRKYVAEPGWSQFGADVRIVQLDLPSGPPAGFSF